MPKTSAALVTARRTPPIAGPTARARFWLTDPSAIACWRSSCGTGSGCSVCQVGALAALPQPITKSSARMTAGVRPESAASTASPVAAISITTCVATISLRRSTRSPSAPAGIAKSRTGRLPTAPIALTSRAELVSETITHWAATVCIHEPTLLTNWALQSRANAGERIGAQPPRCSAAAAASVCGALIAEASRMRLRSFRLCPRATRSTTPPTGSGRCSRAGFRSRSARRSAVTMRTAGRSG